MTRAQHRGSPASDTDAVQAGGPCDYDKVRDALADDIDALEADGPISAARLVGDLSSNLERALERRVSFAALARAFERRGVSATSDAVRVALGRERKRSKAQPGLEQGKGRQATLAPPPTAQSVKVDDGTRADMSAADPQMARETPPTPPRVGVGRHLD